MMSRAFNYYANLYRARCRTVQNPNMRYTVTMLDANVTCQTSLAVYCIDQFHQKEHG